MLTLPFGSPAHHHDPAIGAGNRSFQQEQMLVCVQRNNLKILHCCSDISQLTRHLFPFKDSSGKGAVSDGTAMAKILVRSMRPRKAREPPTFNDAGVAFALRCAG